MSQGKVSAIEAQKKPEPARQLEQEPARQPERGPVQQVAYRRAQMNRNRLRPEDLLALQRTVGNQRVQGMVARQQGYAGTVSHALANIRRKGLLQRQGEAIGPANSKEEIAPPKQKQKDVGDPLSFTIPGLIVGHKWEVTKPKSKIKVTIEIAFARTQLASSVAETETSKQGPEREFKVGQAELFRKSHAGKIAHELEVKLATVEESEELVPGLKMYAEAELGKIDVLDLGELNLFEFKFGFRGDITGWVKQIFDLPPGVVVQAAVYGSKEINPNDLKRLREMLKASREAEAQARASAQLGKELESSLKNAADKVKQAENYEELAKKRAQELDESLSKRFQKPKKGKFKYPKLHKEMSPDERKLYEAIKSNKQLAKNARQTAELARKNASKLRSQIKLTEQKISQALKKVDAIAKKLTTKAARRLGGVILKTTAKIVLKTLSGIGILLTIFEVSSLLYRLLTGKVRFGLRLDEGEGEGKGGDGEKVHEGEAKSVAKVDVSEVKPGAKASEAEAGHEEAGERTRQKATGDLGKTTKAEPATTSTTAPISSNLAAPSKLTEAQKTALALAASKIPTEIKPGYYKAHVPTEAQKGDDYDVQLVGRTAQNQVYAANARVHIDNVLREQIDCTIISHSDGIAVDTTVVVPAGSMVQQRMSTHWERKPVKNKK